MYTITEKTHTPNYAAGQDPSTCCCRRTGNQRVRTRCLRGCCAHSSSLLGIARAAAAARLLVFCLLCAAAADAVSLRLGCGDIYICLFRAEMYTSYKDSLAGCTERPSEHNPDLQDFGSRTTTRRATCRVCPTAAAVGLSGMNQQDHCCCCCCVGFFFMFRYVST